MNIPFVDLKSQYLSLKDELDTAVSKVISETNFISGKYAIEFENSFAQYHNIKHCISCGNGTDALEIGLRAIGIKAGDEVLIPANTWISTSEAVTNVGAKPVFVDIDLNSYNIAHSKIEEKIAPQVKAIIPVHLYGLPAQMDEIMLIARKYNLKVLEDCAQAHGAVYKGKKVGTFGDAGAFSFYPSKNLGAFGDAGGIITNDDRVAENARMIANHGQISKNRHILEGRNSRLDGIQAAVLSVKLPHLDGWLEARRKNAELYSKLLSDTEIITPFVPEHAKHAYHLYVVQVPNRDIISAKLKQDGIETGIHYPISLPFSEAYSHFNHLPTDFPVSYSQMNKILSLPMYPELTNEMIEKVCASLKNALTQKMVNYGSSRH